MLALQEMTATQRFDRAAPRYTEASLVKKLEELGIGLPTYAPTISTVQKRGYVVKENREGTQRPYRILNMTNGDINDRTALRTPERKSRSSFPRTLVWW